MSNQLKLFTIDNPSKKIYYTIDFTQMEISSIKEQLELLMQKLSYIQLGLNDSYDKRQTDLNLSKEDFIKKYNRIYKVKEIETKINAIRLYLKNNQ